MDKKIKKSAKITILFFTLVMFIVSISAISAGEIDYVEASGNEGSDSVDIFIAVDEGDEDGEYGVKIYEGMDDSGARIFDDKITFSSGKKQLTLDSSNTLDSAKDYYIQIWDNTFTNLFVDGYIQVYTPNVYGQGLHDSDEVDLVIEGLVDDWYRIVIEENGLTTVFDNDVEFIDGVAHITLQSGVLKLLKYYDVFLYDDGISLNLLASGRISINSIYVYGFGYHGTDEVEIETDLPDGEYQIRIFDYTNDVFDNLATFVEGKVTINLMGSFVLNVLENYELFVYDKLTSELVALGYVNVDIAYIYSEGLDGTDVVDLEIVGVLDKDGTYRIVIKEDDLTTVFDGDVTFIDGKKTINLDTGVLDKSLLYSIFAYDKLTSELVALGNVYVYIPGLMVKV